MDSNTLLFFVVVVFAVVVIGAFAVYQRRAKVEITGPLGTGVKIDASNEKTPMPPAIDVKNATSTGGGLKAHDETGRGVRADTINTKGDIDLSSRPPAQGDDSKKA